MPRETAATMFGSGTEFGSDATFLADPIVDVTEAASLYSQISGVLAAFAFAGLMAYLVEGDRRRPGSESDQAERPVTVSLFLTLVSLIVVAVLYAILAGGPPDSGAGYLGIMIYGLAFALSILSMFHAITLLAERSRGLRSVTPVFRLWTSLAGPALTVLLVSSASLDVFFKVNGKDASTVGQLWPIRPFGLGLALTGVLLLTIGLASRRVSKLKFEWPWWCPVIPAAVAASTALLAAATAVVLLMQPQSFVPSDALLIVLVSIAFLFSLSFALFSLINMPSSRTEAHSAGPPESDQEPEPDVLSAAGPDTVATQLPASVV
ncbi:hypothetical protein [Asanoa sp. NPDC050611]|uniref:hypothetical protein n=1 Tax=Asanoa sp. NPDC050611 TaxID=3157098 RepID=UPI0033DA60DE